MFMSYSDIIWVSLYVNFSGHDSCILQASRKVTVSCLGNVTLTDLDFPVVLVMFSYQLVTVGPKQAIC